MALNRHQRRAQYAVPSRSKPYKRPRRPAAKALAAYRGRRKIEALIARGIQLNSKPNPLKQTFVGVRRALLGG